MRQSVNQVQAVGSVSELNLKMEEVKYEDKASGKSVNCKCISKVDFRNPSIVINVDGDPCGFDFYPTYEMKYDTKEKKFVNNPRFKSLETIMNYDLGTRVKIDGSFANNEYVNDELDLKSIVRLNAFQCTSTGVPDEDYCDCTLSGVIKTIRPEMVNESETGRLFVDFVYFDRNLDLFPITLVVPEDIAEEFSDYKARDSVKFEIEVKSRTVGGGKKQESRFGKRSSKKVSGFTVTEYLIFDGSEPYDEENELYVSNEDLKKKVEERNISIEQKIEEKKSKASSPKEEKKGLGNRASKKKDEEFLEPTPFDDDDPFGDM